MVSQGFIHRWTRALKKLPLDFNALGFEHRLKLVADVRHADRALNKRLTARTLIRHADANGVQRFGAGVPHQGKGGHQRQQSAAKNCFHHNKLLQCVFSHPNEPPGPLLNAFIGKGQVKMS